MFNKILVPLDGSQLSERALEPAFALARKAEGDVVLLRVSASERMLVPDAYGYGVIWPDQALERSRKEAADYLESIQKSRAQPHLAVHTTVLEGDVSEAILDVAAAHKVDLIVMSSHGYSGVTRWVLGSVAEKVLGSAPCPALVVRTPQPPRRILIPLDGSELSETALTPGLEVALSLGSEVTLLRAVPGVERREIEQLEQVERGLGRRMVDEIREDAENYLRSLLATRPAGRLAVQTIVTEEPAAESILRYAETHATDLIVMSTHGRTGLRRWVYGSVTEKVLRGGPHSMLVIRPAAHHLH